MCVGVLDILPKKRRMGVEGRENTKCERERSGEEGKEARGQEMLSINDSTGGIGNEASGAMRSKSKG